MSLTSKTQILGVQYEADASTVKVAYQDSGRLKRTVVAEANEHVQGWVTDGGTIADYKAPNEGPKQASIVLRP